MDVDYQANRNVLNEALIDNVKTFMYISVFNADKLRHLEIVKAKEIFAQELKEAGIEYIIIRPNGFFSDMAEFFNMANRGRIYLFGKGEFRCNPIHGADLAEVCVKWLGTNGGEFNIGVLRYLRRMKCISSLWSIREEAKCYLHPEYAQEPDS